MHWWGTLGIGGIAFALAAQDTVKNIFGAFTIFTDKAFRHRRHDQRERAGGEP